MTRWQRGLESAVAVLAVAAFALSTVHSWADSDVTYERIKNADKYPGDWMTYHGSYKSWHYSPLDQISSKNVDKLRIAWTHSMPRAIRGLQSMPLAADGVLGRRQPGGAHGAKNRRGLTTTSSSICASVTPSRRSAGRISVEMWR